MATEAQKRAVRKYDDANTIQIKLKLNETTDADILARLAEVPNKQGYIKELIRRDMLHRCKNCSHYERCDGVSSDYCGYVVNGDFPETGYCSYFEQK